MSADADGDSEMHNSSPESDELFPRSLDPIDPSNPNAHQNTTLNQTTYASSELSPPTSQDPPGEAGRSTLDNNAEMIDLEDEGIQTLPTGGVQTRGMGKGETSGMREPDEAAQYEPGKAWKSKRAQEEYARAMESVVDRDFSLREFGDPFDVRDVKGGLK